MKEARLLGLNIHAITIDEAVDVIARFVAEKTPRQGVFLNAGKFAEIDRNPPLKRAIGQADLRLADGQPLLWAGRLLGARIPERVAGIDLMHRLMAEGKGRGWRFFFFGASPEVLEKTVAICRERYGIAVAGFQHGYYRPEEEAAVAEKIRDSGADILFVAMGSPKKELFMDRHVRMMNVPFTMGVGGSFDVVAGLVRRSPRWMQRMGLEWFYRMMQEPGRLWRRYLFGNLHFIRRVAACFFRRCDCCGDGR